MTIDGDLHGVLATSGTSQCWTVGKLPFTGDGRRLPHFTRPELYSR